MTNEKRHDFHIRHKGTCLNNNESERIINRRVGTSRGVTENRFIGAVFYDI